MKRSTPQLKSLFDTIRAFQWDRLVLEDLARVCQWFAQHVNSELILDQDSIVWCALDFLKQACGFAFIEEGHATDQVVVAKRNIYIQVIVTMVTRCSSLKNKVIEFEWIMKQLLADIESTVGLNPTDPASELVTHCSTCLSIQNVLVSGPVATAIKSTISAHLFTTNCAMLVLAFMSAAPRCLATISDMVRLLESAIHCHFVRLCEGELVNSWTPVLRAFVVPELSKDDFVVEAIKQNALLTLYTYNLCRTHQATAQAEQFDIMIDCVTWSSKPQLDKETEAKLMLLWMQIFNIIQVQAAQNQLSDQQWKTIARYVLSFIYFLTLVSFLIRWKNVHNVKLTNANPNSYTSYV